MDLQELKRNWESFAVSDPMWAILTAQDKQGGKWNSEEFFQSGRNEISFILELAARYGFDFQRGSALDFGCGIGRLTQALCQHFERCLGVDIAPSMIAQAQARNQYSDRCTYLQNDRDNLQFLPSGSVDFIYSNIVLQHMEPKYSKIYLKEFIRLLSTGGLLVFQLPSQRIWDPKSEAARSKSTGPLPTSAFRAHIAAPMANIAAAAGEDVSVPLQITNASNVLWPALGLEDGTFQLFVGNHWRNADGGMLRFDDSRSALPHDVLPGQTIVIPFVLHTPIVAGGYVLEFDLGQEKVTWFQDWGSKPLRINASVKSSSIVKSEPNLHLKEKLSHFSKLGKLLSLRRFMPSVDGRDHLHPKDRQRPVMEMYGVPRSQVEKLIMDSGAQLLKVEDEFCAGAEWQSYRYWVRK